MLNVDYHWEKLQTCIVGSCYPPEFFSFIKNSKIRSIMEQISQETNEDLDNLVKLLESFDVKVLRPELDNIETYTVGNKIIPPPLTPRDHIATIGNKVFMPSINNRGKWNQLRGESWPIYPPKSQIEFENLPYKVKEELKKCWKIDKVEELYNFDFTVYKGVEEYVKFTNEIIYDQDIDSAMVIRLGKNLYFGTWSWQSEKEVLNRVSTLFPEYNCHVIDSNGHLDGCLCVVSPNLILATKHISKSTLDKLFYNYEIVEISNKKTRIDTKFKKQSQGKWWIRGEEDNTELVDFVNSYLKFWTGYAEETVSIINMLHIDKNNIICIGDDDKLFKKLKDHEITSHPIKFRHLDFWDSGVHCLTNDLGRIKV
jgi:N-dimethylarginine dimethylaminohydrolase